MGFSCFVYKEAADMARSSFQLDIQTEELDKVLQNMKAACTKEEFRAICRDAFGRSSGRVRRIVQNDLPRHYHGPVRWMTGSVKNGTVRDENSMVTLRIPVRGYRGLIGLGGQFAAQAEGEGGGALLTRQGRLRARADGASLKRQKITAQIVQGQASHLPSTNEEVRKAAQHSGQKVAHHFVMRGGVRAGQIWAREGRHIRPATGIGVPQMPLNRAESDLKNDLANHIAKRVLDDYQRILTGKWRV